MKKKIIALCTITSLLHGIIDFNDSYSLPFTVSGYVKHESFWDTRQVIGVGENQILIFPAPQQLDELCDDVNSRGQYDSVAVESRLHMEVVGPEIKHASSCGVIEGDFFGRIHITNVFDLRLAYFKLTWDHFELLAGQTWHPMFATQVEARTISFNAGLPIEVYARSPQIRCTYKKDHCFNLACTAISELGFVSDGPIGFSNTYMHHAVVPNLNIRGECISGKHSFGAALDYKRIVPRLETNTGLKAHESLNSVSATLFNSLNWESTCINNKIIFAQNGTDLSLIGGYAVKTIDPTTDNRTYANINALSLWTDWQFRNDKPFRFGFFAGFAKNLGARTCIVGNEYDDDCNLVEKRVYGGGTDIDNLFRISPRFSWVVQDFEFATELEYTRAAFGRINEKAQVRDTCPVGNVRLLLAMFYYL